jgi:PAS domain-containing protein
MAKSAALHHRADHLQLQQLVAALTDGVILVEPDQTIAWANAAALRMHGVDRVEELGATVSEYRERFELRYRNRHRLPPGQYPWSACSRARPSTRWWSRWRRPARRSPAGRTASAPWC